MSLPAWRVEEHSQLPSTQEQVKERLVAGENVDGLVVRAGEQPAGQGRRGRAWASARGGSYQTAAVKDRWHGALRAPSLTLHIAVCIAEELREAGAKTTVKWPNDVYLGEGKLAGVLCEYLREHLLVGVGMNVNNPVPDGASSLNGWQLGFVNGLVLDAVRKAVGESLATAASSLERGDGAEAGETAASHGSEGSALAQRFSVVDHLAGRLVTVNGGGGAVTGIASGIDDGGALLLEVEVAAGDAGRGERWGEQRSGGAPDGSADGSAVNAAHGSPDSSALRSHADTRLIRVSHGTVLKWL